MSTVIFVVGMLVLMFGLAFLVGAFIRAGMGDDEE